MQQIPTNLQIDNDFSITTPLSIKVFHNQRTQSIDEPESQPQKLELKLFPNVHGGPGILHNHNVYPNHRYDLRRRLEEINEPRPFEYILRGTPPAGFERTHQNSSNFPQIPKEYVGTVNSIQDILKQMGGGDVSNPQESNGLQKIKISGTYKHRKVDDITGMFEPVVRKNRGQNIDEPVIQSHSVPVDNVFRDPFYKYKPSSLSDVNLMATNQFRFAPAPYNILSNKYVPMTSPSMDPANLYNQIIMANKNRLKYLEENSKNDNVQSNKQKPFTLMLDVYPMPDDEHISSTVPLPIKYKNHFNPHMMRHPGISSINNLQTYYPNANYPQMSGNRYPNLPHYHNPNYFRKFGTKQFNSGAFPTNDRESGGNNPSQITVHLNLFPKKKERSPDQNAEIFNKNDKVIPEENNSIGIHLQDRMSKQGDKVNQTEEQKGSLSAEKISNKVDMDALQSTTVSSVKHNNNVIMIDESSHDIDSSEDIFSKEFFQFQTTDSPPQILSDSTTFESKSDDNHQFNLIPTILPIEPREYDHKMDMKTVTVH